MVKSVDPESLSYAEQALELARRTGNANLMSRAARGWANCAQTMGRYAEAGPFMLAVYRELMRTGAPHEAGKLAVFAALLLQDWGDWHQSRALLRDALAIRLPTEWMRKARLFTAQLAARCGQLSAAQQHLDRAVELARPGGGGIDNAYIWTAVEVLQAQRNYRAALALIALEIEAVARTDAQARDELMVNAAEASADLCEHDPAQRSAAIKCLDEIAAGRATAGPAMFEPYVLGDPYPAMLAALYAAHRSRASNEYGGDVGSWKKAVDACDAAGHRWRAAQARYRLASALLSQRRSHSRAATLLRQGLQVATDLGAEPLRADIEALAVQAHISLAEPAVVEVPPVDGPQLDGLTKREHEVLTHLVAGRTYAEIAAALFISEKTVSAHVSNLLRKTGKPNRIELASLARQTSPPGRD